ncbi:MAG: fibronectin type III domain-containing protein, partial [Chitinophagales bacterium]
MKKTLLFLIVIAFSIHAFALTSIKTKKVLDGPFCPGAHTTVGYTVDAAANSGNVFTAQLSDKDGNFTSPINIGSIVKTTNGNIPCTIPTGLPSGTKYRIRVVSSNPAVIGSTTQNKIGINPKPNDLSVTGVNACQATLNWTSLPTAASYKVQYRLAGNGAWSESIDVGTNTSYTFTGLFSSMSYEFQVRAVCSGGEKSDWSKKTSSTAACATPTNLIVTAVGLTTSSLDWADAACT